MPIHEQERAYKRGVVLGLTLAEVVILVVFSLLLLFAVSTKIDSRPQVEAGKDTMRDVERQLREMQRRQALPPDQFWRELVRAYEEQRRRSVQADAPATDEAVRRRVIAEMDELKGTQQLDAYWLELRRAHAQAPLDKDALRKLLDEKRAAEEGLKRAAEALAKARDEAKRAQKELADMRKAADSRKGHSWPPIISLEEASGYSFRRGDSSLTREFEEKLKTKIVQQILAYTREFDVDVIEIVGHTDEQWVRGTASNLDQQLIAFLHGNGHVPLSVSDNAGLGMARAAAVTRFLRGVPELAAFKGKIFPLSSAQVLDEHQKLADGVSSAGDRGVRRRIEIRLRRLNASAAGER